MTPAAKPSIELRIFLLIDLKKKTIDEPAAVTNHVNSVAINANRTGLRFNNSSIICSFGFMIESISPNHREPGK
jgi:hypothetical protein